jgi:Transmembrane secretion effector
MTAALRPFRLPGFPSLGVAYLVNELGNWLGEIALAVLVFDQTGSPVATAALFGGMQFVPALVGPPIVARVEYLDPRVGLPLLYATEALAFGGLAFLAAGDRFALAPVLLLATVDGSIAAAARAMTRATAAAVLTPAGQLREGNALLNFCFTAGAAAGPAIAGIVVAGAGVQAGLLIDAGSFLAVATLLAASRYLPFTELDPADAPGEGWVGRLRRTFAYVQVRPALRRLLSAQAAAFVFFALVLPIEVVFAKETLDAGDTGYGFLLASWGAGMVTGSLLFAGLRKVSLRRLLWLSTLAIGVAYIGTAASPTLAVACAASFLGGTGNGIQWIALVTAVQTLTSAAQQARVLALLGSIASAMPGVGFVLGGAAAALAGPRLAFAIAGAGVLAVLALATIALRRVDITIPPADSSANGTPGEATEPATSLADAGLSATTPVSEI